MNRKQVYVRALDSAVAIHVRAEVCRRDWLVELSLDQHAVRLVNYAIRTGISDQEAESHIGCRGATSRRPKCGWSRSVR